MGIIESIGFDLYTRGSNSPTRTAALLERRALETAGETPSSRFQELFARAKPSREVLRYGFGEFGEHLVCRRARGLYQPGIVFQAGKAQHRGARLPCAQEFARTANFKVATGNF